MMHPLRRPVGYALRIIVVGACCLGIWSSLELARADYLFKQDTEASIRSAIRLVPDGWEYYMRLAQFDQAHAHELLTNSLSLNRYDAQADIELGLQYEADGDFGRAEKQLLQAFEVDHTYLPRWSLANYYLRRDNIPACPPMTSVRSFSCAGALRPIPARLPRRSSMRNPKCSASTSAFCYQRISQALSPTLPQTWF